MVQIKNVKVMRQNFETKQNLDWRGRMVFQAGYGLSWNIPDNPSYLKLISEVGVNVLQRMALQKNF